MYCKGTKAVPGHRVKTVGMYFKSHVPPFHICAPATSYVSYQEAGKMPTDIFVLISQLFGKR